MIDKAAKPPKMSPMVAYNHHGMRKRAEGIGRGSPLTSGVGECGGGVGLCVLGRAVVLGACVVGGAVVTPGTSSTSAQ